jgi:hypothetical protein
MENSEQSTKLNENVSDDRIIMGKKIPVVTIEDNAGDSYTFIPVATVVDTTELLVQLLEQTAIQMTIQPGLTPEPNPNHVKFVVDSLAEQMQGGLITQEQIDKIDPVFQSKYEMNFQNLVSSIVSSAAERLVKHYQSLNIIQTPGAVGKTLFTGR